MKLYFFRSCLKINHFYSNNNNINNAQCAAKLLEYADRCVAAYDEAADSDRSAAMKTALSASFHGFSRLKSNLQYYATMMTPLDNPPIPSQVLVPMYEIASSAHQLSPGLTASQLQTISFNVPASPFKIGIGIQVADAGTGDIKASKDMARFHFPKVQHLSVNYAGYQGGSGAYTSARNSPERPFTDFCQSTLAAQQGRAASVDMATWSEAPLYLFRFAKPANNVSSNATVRISFTETLKEGANVFCFAYYQSTAAISYDNSGMVTGAENACAS